MTKILIVISLIFPVVLFAQISGEVEFGTEYLGMSIDTATIKTEELKDDVVMHDKNSKIALSEDESYFTVYFKESGALTEFIAIMAIDEQQMSPLDYILISEYFIQNHVLYEKRSSGKEDYFVKTDVAYNWDLKEEYKKILGYRCQKPTTVFKAKKKDIPITAWFTLEIPLSYGPYRYFGLPGFILEVKELGRRHYARKIRLNKKMKVEFPKKENLLTLKEYKNR